MAWDFSTDPEWAAQLAWVDEFVRAECEPIDLIVKESHYFNHPVRQALIPPLQQIVKEQGLWACHLGPELGGQGYGQLKLALMNEILGRRLGADRLRHRRPPNRQRRDPGLVRHGRAKGALPSAVARGRYRVQLLDDRAPGGRRSQGVRAKRHAGRRRVGDRGRKVVLVPRPLASFLIVMAVTDPDAPPHERMSMFIVPAETPASSIIRNVATMDDRDDLDEGTEGYIRYNQVRVPLDTMLGAPGEGFMVAQTRLGGGRVHHAMRAVGKCQRAFDMMCERALSRRTQGEPAGRAPVRAGVDRRLGDPAGAVPAAGACRPRGSSTTSRHGAAAHTRLCKAAAQVLHDMPARAVQLHGRSAPPRRRRSRAPGGSHRAGAGRRADRGAQGQVAHALLGRMPSRRPAYSPPNTCCGCARPPRPSSPTSSPAFRGANRATHGPAKVTAATPTPWPPSRDPAHCADDCA